MRLSLILLPVLAGLAAAKPQQLDLDIVKDIFGDAPRAGEAGYGPAGGEEGAYTDNNNAAENIDVVVQVVKEADDGYSGNLPADYSDNTDPADKALVETNDQFENCDQYTEQYGYECVPYYQCHNGTIITDGAGLIDIRGGFGSLAPEDSKCPGFLDVCCKDPDFIPPPPPKIVHKPLCGRRNNNGVGARIQGFSEGESQFGEWPHMCAVLHDKPLDNGETANLYKCGGSLIAPGVILTAAHCVEDFKPIPQELKVRCGEWDTQQQSEPYPHQDRKGYSVKVHPEYQKRNLANDFALIFLEEEFQLDYHIDTVCLPQPNENFDYEQCFATGWGKDKFGAEGDYQVVLKEVDLNIVNNVDCQAKLRETRLGKRFKLDPSFICAGGVSNKDTCKGDGGSPLVCPQKNDPTRYDQAGIVAWGIGCGSETPGVYAGVSKAVCWIDYAMTCFYGQSSGDYSTFLGYEQSQCGTWMEEKLQDFDAKIAAGGQSRIADVFTNLKSQYTTCTVNWLTAIEEPCTGSYCNSNLDEEDLGVDIGAFGRDGTNVEKAVKISEDSYSTDNAPKVVKEAVDAAAQSY